MSNGSPTTAPASTSARAVSLRWARSVETAELIPSGTPSAVPDLASSSRNIGFPPETSYRRRRSASETSAPIRASASALDRGARSITVQVTPAERAAATSESATVPGRKPMTRACDVLGGRLTRPARSSRLSGSAHWTSSSARTGPRSRASSAVRPRYSSQRVPATPSADGPSRGRASRRRASGTSLSSSVARPSTGSSRRARARSTSRPRSRVLPIPASPRMTRSRCPPPATASRAPSSRAISSSRPTICTSRALHPPLRGTGDSLMFQGDAGASVVAPHRPTTWRSS